MKGFADLYPAQERRLFSATDTPCAAVSSASSPLAIILAEQNRAGRALATAPESHPLRIWAADWLMEEILVTMEARA